MTLKSCSELARGGQTDSLPFQDNVARKQPREMYWGRENPSQLLSATIPFAQCGAAELGQQS